MSDEAQTPDPEAAEDVDGHTVCAVGPGQRLASTISDPRMQHRDDAKRRAFGERPSEKKPN